jgi:uncharacterized linocin/CFP29 family protein
MISYFTTLIYFYTFCRQRNVSGEILKEVSSFEDKLIEEMFELKSVKEFLKKEEQLQQSNLSSHEAEEKQLRDLLQSFSRFKLVNAN